jgi:hypothetical protein
VDPASGALVDLFVVIGNEASPSEGSGSPVRRRPSNLSRAVGRGSSFGGASRPASPPAAPDATSPARPPATPSATPPATPSATLSATRPATSSATPSAARRSSFAARWSSSAAGPAPDSVAGAAPAGADTGPRGRRWWVIGPVAGVVLAAAVGVPVWVALQAEAPIGGSPAGVPLAGGGAAAGTPEQAVVPESDAPLAAPAPSGGLRSAGAPSATARPGGSGKVAKGTTPAAAPVTSKPAVPGSPAPGLTGRPGTGADLALRRPVTVSGREGDAYEAAKAVDGDDSTRWSSNWSEHSWIAVDLGDIWAVSRVEVLWERSYAELYHIDVSTDGRTWRTAAGGITGAEGKVGTALGDVPARWVRVVNDRRHQERYGISLFSLGVR